jgi:hypothetical protein
LAPSPGQVLLGQNGDFAHGRGAHVCQAVVSLQVFQDGYGLGFLALLG